MKFYLAFKCNQFVTVKSLEMNPKTCKQKNPFVLPFFALTEPVKPFPLFICRGSCNLLFVVQKTWPATVTAAPMANITLGWALMKATVSRSFYWIHQKRLKYYTVFLYLLIPSSISSYILGSLKCFVLCLFVV